MSVYRFSLCSSCKLQSKSPQVQNSFQSTWQGIPSSFNLLLHYEIIYLPRWPPTAFLLHSAHFMPSSWLVCFFFLSPELYAPKPYSAFEIVPGPLYSSKLRAMAQLLIDKPIEKLPVEGQGFMFLQTPPLPHCSPAPIWSQVADVFYLACFCTFSTLWFTAVSIESLEQIRFLVWIEDI